MYFFYNTLMFVNTLLFSGSVTILNMASGGNPTLNLTFMLQKDPLGTETCKIHQVWWPLKISTISWSRIISISTFLNLLLLAPLSILISINSFSFSSLSILKSQKSLCGTKGRRRIHICLLYQYIPGKKK